MKQATYLIFGDLHGRILPAFRLALLWAADHGERLDGLLQVGDLGYFPDSSRLDKATSRFAARDPLELGVQMVTVPNAEADAIFAEPDLPEGLWFTPGNHEDHDELHHLAGGSAASNSFPVDFYHRVWCLPDGGVETLPGGLRVGALWGIDDAAPRARRKTPPGGCIKPRSATALAGETFDVLLTHESPRDAVVLDSGSEAISAVIRLAQPAFAFFGHYGGTSRQASGPFGRAQVYRLGGLEFRGRKESAEADSVGVLRWRDGVGNFSYLDPDWLLEITRTNWRHRKPRRTNPARPADAE